MSEDAAHRAATRRHVGSQPAAKETDANQPPTPSVQPNSSAVLAHILGDADPMPEDEASYPATGRPLGTRRPLQRRRRNSRQRPLIRRRRLPYPSSLHQKSAHLMMGFRWTSKAPKQKKPRKDSKYEHELRGPTCPAGPAERKPDPRRSGSRHWPGSFEHRPELAGPQPRCPCHAGDPRRRLYKKDYGTFKSYLLRRWQISLPRGYQMLHFARLIRMSTAVDTGGPENERRARLLDGEGKARRPRRRCQCYAPWITW